MKKTIQLVLTAALVGLAATHLQAQGVPTPVPEVGEPVFSMGQPAKYQLHGALLGMTGSGEVGLRGVIGAHKAFMNPVAGILGLTGEAFYQPTALGQGAGLRLLATSRVLGLSAGLVIGA